MVASISLGAREEYKPRCAISTNSTYSYTSEKTWELLEMNAMDQRKFLAPTPFKFHMFYQRNCRTLISPQFR